MHILSNNLLNELFLFNFTGKWCQRRTEWNSPPDAQRAAATEAARRGVLYSSVFLGSPGKSKKNN